MSQRTPDGRAPRPLITIDLTLIRRLITLIKNRRRRNRERKNPNPHP